MQKHKSFRLCLILSKQIRMPFRKPLLKLDTILKNTKLRTKLTINFLNAVGIENKEPISGLYLGEEIVTNGTFAIDAPAQLAGKPSRLNPEGNHTSTASMPGMDMRTKSAKKKLKI